MRECCCLWDALCAFKKHLEQFPSRALGNPAPAPEKPADHQDVSPVVRAAVLVTQCALPLLGTMKADEITF